ncbi:aromatic ring-hydroxylating oxygenase subunit alpha [Streptomyces violaceusniger]|uniref:Rieske (2Fe-2S) iron-sulfur domain-containing protein n=1 Tax=Streptomyces violaceusniger (strain Tu 4113) TaxID=653045 RepID=G2NUA3_STRV4|nr:aromatic ring-hydroxylating dioxygenase subunit alpha [Streptomyces violaceusniger]AEM84137.1 Rieske (2Fe-2S) iron-sulfur domain-containing protein [Streptomyces violaceusniger Tu 4113]
MNPVTAAAQVTELVSRRPVGQSLQAPFYVDEEFHHLDIEAVFTRHWIFVATEAELPEPGDYATVTLGTYSVILVRDDDEDVRAFHNVCRHRGTRILGEEHGSVGNIVCGYHRWTYGVDGKLLHVESQAPGFDPTCFSLRSVHVRTVAGLVFICLAEEPPEDFDEVATRIEPYLAPHNLAKAKVATQTDLIENGNWKLVMENNRECYHCTGHPELQSCYFPIYGYQEQDIPPVLRSTYERYQQADAEARKTYESLGLPYAEIEELDTRTTGFHIHREPLDLAGESYTSDGTAACKRLLADFPTARLGRLSLHMQPNSWCHFMADHAITFSVIPLARDRTLLRTTWLVHADAVEGADYDLDTLTKVWKATNDQDAVFVARAQRGVSSPAYLPGPYSPTEYQVEAFINWYITRLKAHLEQQR